MRFKNGSNLKHLCLSKNEKRWQTKQEKMIKAHNGARSHALNHSSNETSSLLQFTELFYILSFALIVIKS